MGLARAGSQLYLFENQFGVYSSPSQRCQKYSFLVLKSHLSNFRTNLLGMDQLKLIRNDVRTWLSINTKQYDMNKMHVCPLNAIRSIFWSTLAWLFLKNVTVEKETGKILRTGVQFLAPAMGLEIAVTATRSSNFQFTESQAKRLSLEPFYSSSQKNSTNFRESGFDEGKSVPLLLMTRNKLGLDIIFQIFSESWALFCILCYQMRNTN